MRFLQLQVFRVWSKSRSTDRTWSHSAHDAAAPVAAADVATVLEARLARRIAQSLQNPLIKEYTLNYDRDIP